MARCFVSPLFVVQALDLSTRALSDDEVVSGVLFGVNQGDADLYVQRGQELSLGDGNSFDATHISAIEAQIEQFDAVSPLVTSVQELLLRGPDWKRFAEVPTPTSIPSQLSFLLTLPTCFALSPWLRRCCPPSSSLQLSRPVGVFTTSLDERVQSVLVTACASFCSGPPYLAVLRKPVVNAGDHATTGHPLLPMRMRVLDGDELREVSCTLGAEQLQADAIDATLSFRHQATGEGASANEITTHIEGLQVSTAAMVEQLDVILRYLEATAARGTKPSHSLLRMANALRNQVRTRGPATTQLATALRVMALHSFWRSPVYLVAKCDALH